MVALADPGDVDMKIIVAEIMSSKPYRKMWRP